MAKLKPDVLSRYFTEETLKNVYNYERHVAIGEALDVAGELGGYNLHWAWASGFAAGRAA